MTVGYAYSLPLRQSVGFVESILALTNQKDLQVPHFSTISRRQNSVEVIVSTKLKEGENLHIAADSTGLKVYGEGEWKVRQHGISKRRTWMKLHLTIDVNTQEIVELALSKNSKHDSQAGSEMLKGKLQKVNSFRGDGGYDHFSFREILGDSILQIIPPPENAVESVGSENEPVPDYLRQRNQAVYYLSSHERSEWKKEVGYHRRSLNEVVMFRYKVTFGDRLKARIEQNQSTEVKVKCKILNVFRLTGMPVSLKVV